MIKYYHTYVAWFIFLLCLSACSSERNNFISKTYHNTTGHYNAYFIAKEYMKEIERAVYESEEHDYDKILHIYPTIDTLFIKSLETQLDECIKKSSLVIQWHKNSKWVDDSYVLIGKSRFYNHEFIEAIETFKYVNTKSDDNDSRHEALVNLMRTFVDYEEESNAVAVSDYLKKETLHPKNLKALYLTRAYLYQRRKDYENMAKNLVMAAPLMKKGEGKDKIFFILGQINQMYGFDEAAYNNYKRCLKSNPVYEMSFYARLNMAQVLIFPKGGDSQKARKFFKKLLKDSKNKKYKDKIYYELAMFELKQDRVDDAIAALKNAVFSNQNNQKVKAYSYLRLGEIYYEHLKAYELAKKYYDSTIQVMPQDEPDYENIKKRQEVLADFVLHVNTIREQDSLLVLSQLDSFSLNTLVDNVIKENEMKRKEEEKALAKASRRSASFTSQGVQDNIFEEDNTNGTWYFYNTSQISLGRSEFLRRWGARVLEDNWRRSKKQPNADFDDRSVSVNQDTVRITDRESSAADIRAVERAQILQNIPFTDEAKNIAYKKIEDAYYNLGKIYHFDLYEEKNAIHTFDTLLIRFPKTDYKSEVLYLLYLIYQELEDGQSITYKNLLVNEFPHSIYAKTVKNPNYVKESEAAAEQVREIYEVAFKLFKQHNYAETKKTVSLGLNDFPENEFSAHLKLLEILIIGKTEDLNNYQYALQDFIETNPDSPLNEYAKLLLSSSRKHKIRTAKLEGVNYTTQLNQPHSFVLLYPANDTLPKEGISFLDSLQSTDFNKLNLKTINLILDDSNHMMIIEEFPNKEKAMLFYNILKKDNSPFTQGYHKPFRHFIITKKNFELFYEMQDIAGYAKFFSTHYQ